MTGARGFTRSGRSWLDAIEPAQVERALADTSSGRACVGASIGGALARNGNHPLVAKVLALMGDPSWTVRRQLAATIGELLGPRGSTAAVIVLTRTATIGCRGRHGQRTARKRGGGPDRLLWRASRGARGMSCTMLAAAVARSGDVAAVQQLLARVRGCNGPVWQRTAVLQGLDAGLLGGGAGGAAAAGADVVHRRLAACASRGAGRAHAACRGGRRDEHDREAGRGQADWRGTRAGRARAPPLTAEEQKRFAAGIGSL